ncbi:MAG: glutamyl-tRNA reductase [Chthoniobacterales bacterium]
MNILCAGISHHTADVDIREKLAVPDHHMDAVLREVREIEGLSEAVVLSTCNRVEFYAASICPARAFEGLEKYLFNRTGIRAPLYFHDSPQSIRHLFRVASGIDSMVVGETEILGQVKQAYASAHGRGATARHLNKLFQHAFRAAKYVRTKTRITSGPVSVGSVAVDLAEKIFGQLTEKKVMILGAGDTSERTARSLQSRGVKSIIVSNRTFERAAALAEEIGGMAIHYENWHNIFPEVDILISSTSAPHPILTREKLAPLIKARDDRPLFIIDLAVPRDAEPELNELDSVFLYDIDSLQQIATQSLAVRQQEVLRCEQLVEEHVTEFLAWMRKLHGGYPAGAES